MATRHVLIIVLLPLAAACAAPATAPAVQQVPAPVVQQAPAPGQPAVQQAPAAAPAQPAPPAGAAAAPAELGRRFVQALIAGDAGGASAQLSDAGRRRLEARTPDYARALATCASGALEGSASQNQAMTNVLVQFAPPCGRFGDIAPLQAPGTAEPGEAEKKIGGCLVAFRTVNNALRVENFACTPA